MTHAVPIVGLETRSFTETTGQFFMSGGYLLNALLTNNIDLAYIGPGPYLNALNKGVKLKVLALSSTGANSLILSDKFDENKSYYIERIAVPQLGNTQDLLAKILVKKIKARNNRVQIFSGHMADLKAYEKIRISDKLEYIQVNPAELETAFYTEAIDSALVAEPWGTLLESKGYVNLHSFLSSAPRNMIEELDASGDNGLIDLLGDINKFPAALLVVKEDFYNLNQKRVDRFLQEQNIVLNAIKKNNEIAITIIKTHLEDLTKKDFAKDFLVNSFAKVNFPDQLDKKKLEKLAKISYQSNYFRKELNL